VRGSLAILFFLFFLPFLTGFPMEPFVFQNDESAYVKRTLNRFRQLVQPNVAGQFLKDEISILETDRSTDISLRESVFSEILTGLLYIKLEDHSNALYFLRKAQEHAAQLEATDLVSLAAYYQLGKYFSEHNLHEMASPHLIRVISNMPAEQILFRFWERNALISTIDCLYHLGKQDSAFQVIETLISKAKKHSDKALNNAKNTKAFYLIKSEQYDEAYDILSELLSDYKFTGTRRDSISYFNFKETKVHALFHFGYQSEAIETLKEVIAYRESIFSFGTYCRAIGYLIDYYKEINDTKSAAAYILSKQTFFIENMTSNNPNYHVLSEISELLDAEGYHNQAIIFNDMYHRKHSEYIGKNGIIEKQDALINEIIAQSNKAMDQNLLLERIKNRSLRNRVSLITWLSILGGLTLISILLLFFQKRKNDIHRIVEKQNSDRQKQKILTLENDNLKYQLELKQKDIELLATDNKTRTSIKKQVVSSLDKIEKLPEGQLKKAINSLRLDLNQMVNSQDVYDKLQENIKEIDTAFERNLEKQFNGISATEIKLCKLIKLGLVNNEIASIFGKTESTIRSRKHRLHQKSEFSSIKEMEAAIRSI